MLCRKPSHAHDALQNLKPVPSTHRGFRCTLMDPSKWMTHNFRVFCVTPSKLFITNTGCVLRRQHRPPLSLPKHSGHAPGKLLSFVPFELNNLNHQTYVVDESACKGCISIHGKLRGKNKVSLNKKLFFISNPT